MDSESMVVDDLEVGSDEVGMAMRRPRVIFNRDRVREHRDGEGVVKEDEVVFGVLSDEGEVKQRDEAQAISTTTAQDNHRMSQAPPITTVEKRTELGYLQRVSGMQSRNLSSEFSGGNELYSEAFEIDGFCLKLNFLFVHWNVSFILCYLWCFAYWDLFVNLVLGDIFSFSLIRGFMKKMWF
ncbi:hypothetical protein E2542_SST06560 [Spatholobus suberectus]|nr:hypothetical protein E2542_SST06560 [Spatholobus suberectus]